MAGKHRAKPLGGRHRRTREGFSLGSGWFGFRAPAGSGVAKHRQRWF
jgi:hypothetical protein